MTQREKVSRIGTPVIWRKEVYRVHYRNRPIERGTVIAVDGAILTVQRADGTTCIGNWSVFSVDEFAIEESAI